VTLDRVSHAIQATADALYVPYLMVLLFSAGIFLTLRYRVVQVRRFREAVGAFVVRDDSPQTGGVLTPFQAFMTALAATIGTGNIAGVAAGIVSGGPGALFWIWCYGFVATAVKFSEAVLGVRFRDVLPAGTRSGPMYYLRDGLRSSGLAWTYALVAGVAALTTTPFTQTNSIALVWHTQAGVPTWVSGLIVGVFAWLVVIGGIRSIGRAAEKLTPLKVGLYLIGGCIVLVTFASRLPEVLGLVFREAFSVRAAAGGSAAMVIAMRYGLARGMYANEAGYGTAAVAYGTAKSRQPLDQGLNAVMEVFIVSFVTCSISALAVLLTGAYRSGQTSTAAVALAFDAAVPGIGGWIVAVSVLLFGYTTLIGWAYYGEQFLEYILGPRIVLPYRWTYCLLIPFGAIAKVDVVWAWGDLMNALQIFPNLAGIIGLSGLVAAVARAPRVLVNNAPQHRQTQRKS
jgi:alanine or glycine:cation symporter, AGCS family